MNKAKRNGEKAEIKTEWKQKNKNINKIQDRNETKKDKTKRNEAKRSEKRETRENEVNRRQNYIRRNIYYGTP